MKLILPINNCRLTASYQNESYRSRFGFSHYGVDLISTSPQTRVYVSGDGVVLATGYDNVVGNTIVVRYNNAYCQRSQQTVDLIVRYFHMRSIAVNKGQNLNKDTVLGEYGNTGSFSTGAHLHLEVDQDVDYPLYTPTIASSSFLKGSRAGATASTMSNPLSWLHCKTSSPDNQSWSTTEDNYINKEDKEIPQIS